ncbi:MAG: acetate/propionate family kinase [Galactobacter sp.]
MLVLVINSGSSSLKYQVRDTETDALLLSGHVEGIGSDEVPDHGVALDVVEAHLTRDLGEDPQLDAAGHRIVHGGERFSEPVLIDYEITRAIERLAPLAPLHNPAHALGIRAIMTKWPSLPQVAVFDTAFHRSMPEYAWRYAVPNELYTVHGVRKYGFHGTSVGYVSGKASELLGIPMRQFDAVVAHLGAGASITAVKGGRSVDTSMGYTPLAGLVMGTRSGDVDPSVLTQLMIREEYTAQDLDRMLNKEAGLLGLTGTADMREVVDRAAAGEHHAELALAASAYRVQKYVGSYHVAVDGAKALIFTAGIGENSWQFRERVCSGLGALGISLDRMSNLERSKEARIISSAESAIPVLVVPTDEEAAIAHQTAALVGVM